MMRTTRKLVGLALVGSMGLGGCAAPLRTSNPEARAAEARFAEHPEGQEETSPEQAQAERDAFARQAMEALRSSGETRPIHYDAEGFLLRLGDKDGTTVFLANFFDESLAVPPEKRDEVFARISRVRSMPDLPATLAEARQNLLPVVRSRTFFEQLHLVMKGPPGKPPPIAWKPLGGFLGVGLAFDGPDTLRYLGPDELTRWDISFEQALGMALENLRPRSTEALEQLAPGTCKSPWEDSYAASRLLLDEVVRRCPVKGTPVVLVPHRDLLLITGSEDEDGLNQVASKALGAMMAPRALDGRAMRLAPEGWVPFMPERLNNAWGDFRQLELFTRARDYDEQTQQLEKLYEEKGVDLFVAAYTPYQDERGRSLSYAVWLKGVDAVLPRAEVIFFMDPSLGPEAPPVGIARWEEVSRVAGQLLAPVEGLYPERYRVTSFPTPEQLARWQNDPGDLFDEDGP
ncbi:uncharacterized protein YtpQ (UPF0354 family) [Archangium gephyra]|uniref:Uncharacterized protein YtpQ (UPF0354 family) n=1 Tax=Archangium gephyra TaxID=48 RepID=A0AAC8TJ36_9BACT|nr:hypothetical protein [Archangium gephyra]AKJ07977.1 Hypothetical protein AA314_09603 [Archangium gephyra]REG29721.1 uncharacterized protein YtpQ (UPF0354 family) [Archangium gephyra]